MKKKLFGFICLCIISSTLIGCYGKFALTRKLYALNGEISNKYARSGLTWVLIILPVYPVVGLVDFVVLNTVEFWSGKNPIALLEKDIQYVDGVDRYEIHAVKDGERLTYRIDRYTFDRYSDSLTVDWNIANERAYSSFDDGLATRKNYLVSTGEFVHLNLRQMGETPQNYVIAAK